MTIYYPSLTRVDGSRNLYDYAMGLRCHCGAKFRPFDHPSAAATATCRGDHISNLSLNAGAQGPVKAETVE